MFGLGGDHWALNKQLFEEQFEADGTHFLYRRDQKAPPIRVTSAEKDRFVADYARRLKHAARALVAGMLLFTTIVVTWAMIDDSEPSSIAIYVGMGGMAAALVIYILWTSAAPARELARRAPIGRARTRAELKQRMTGQMTYSYIVATAVGGLMLPAILGDGEGYLEGLNAVWTALGIVILGIAAFAAIRKWRFDHKHDG